MARPLKTGLDYFPHSCISEQSIDLLQAEFGASGYAVIYRLYEKIYSEKGYFCEWTKDAALMFSHRNRVGINTVSEILKSALRRGIFDSGLYSKYGILTSRDIQETYIEATAKRKRIFLFKEYLLVSCTLLPDYVCINSVNGNINSVNSVINPQSKVKESKVKKSKEEKRKSSEHIIRLPCRNGDYALNTKQLEQLRQIYKNIDVMQSLRKMFDFLKAHPESQRTSDTMDNYIEMWLSDDNKKALAEKEEAEKKKSNVSYDISAFKEYDIFE